MEYVIHAYQLMISNFFQNKYDMDWSKKYLKERKILKSDEIAKYGGQILEVYTLDVF